ncbi:MAG: PAS domain-containing protein [Desulfobacteraceae bacterium]|nr:MAG: PAS domain-containing protein [Desulfobacteraceae bacterium]
MVNPGLSISHELLKKRLQKLIFLRALFAFSLLGISLFFQFNKIQLDFVKIGIFHYGIIAAIFFLTAFYFFYQKFFQPIVKIAYVQLLLDTLIVTAIVYATGGIESPLSFLYILTIITGSIILYRKGGMIVASSSSILYGLLLDLHFYGVIQPIGSGIFYVMEYRNTYILFLIVMNIAAFYLVAFLSSYPSEQERKSRVELQAKQDDIIKLEILNERIIHSITSGLLTIDNFHRIILFNPAAEKIFSVKAGEVIGCNALDFFPFLEPYFKNYSGGSDFKIQRPAVFVDAPYRNQAGRTLFLRFSISTLDFPEGKRRGWILVFQDMTEIRQIEEEMKKVEGLAMVGELAAGIAHEIRNPMASISGSIQMLKEGLMKDDVNSRLMEIVLREIHRLNHLVNEFLLFARPKQNDTQEFDLHQVIAESLDLFQNSEKASDKIEIKTQLSGSRMIKSDPEKIKQVLWNLLLNAREAMPDGGCLWVGTELLTHPEKGGSGQEKVQITIRDTGKGFSSEALLHLFTPFYTTKEGGSGLGLAIVKRIIEGLQGKISGRNHSAGGAEIIIFLDLLPQS